MRQFGGAGVPGCMEALVHFQRMVCRIASDGKARIPLCRVAIDQENFFGSLLWEEIRREVMDATPWRAGLAAWKYAKPTRVQQLGAEPHLSDRGTGQGDVDAPTEASLVQGAIARDTRRAVHEQQVVEGYGSDALRRDVTHWCNDWDAWTAKPSEERARRDDANVRHGHKGDAIIQDGHLLDVWYLDDGDSIMHPAMALQYLKAFDASSSSRGAKRNLEKTKVTMLMQREDAMPMSTDWHLQELQELATIEWEPDSSITLGAETVTEDAMALQFQEKTQVVQSMLQKIPWARDAQVELVLQRSCLGTAKINHLLRVNGVELSQRKEVLQAFLIMLMWAPCVGWCQA